MYNCTNNNIEQEYYIKVGNGIFITAQFTFYSYILSKKD